MNKMKGKIVIPEGYIKLPQGCLVKDGDFCIHLDTNLISPIIEWQEWTDIEFTHLIKSGELFIRKKGERQ